MLKPYIIECDFRAGATTIHGFETEEAARLQIHYLKMMQRVKACRMFKVTAAEEIQLEEKS